MRLAPTGCLAAERFLFNTKRCAVSTLFRNCFYRSCEIIADRTTRCASCNLDRACARDHLPREDGESSPARGRDVGDNLQGWTPRSDENAQGCPWLAKCVGTFDHFANRTLGCLELSHVWRSHCYWLQN